MPDENDKLPGYEWIIFVARKAAPTVWIPVGCLTSNDMDLGTDTEDTTSKCDGGDSSIIPTTNNWALDGSGFSVDDRGLSKASFLTMFKIWQAKELVGLKFAKASSDAADWYYQGMGYITKLKETSEVKNSKTFDVTFTGIGRLNLGGSY